MQEGRRQSDALFTALSTASSTVDWFLDRCRTAINVMGDMTVSALLDGKKRKLESELSIVEQRDDLPAKISD